MLTSNSHSNSYDSVAHLGVARFFCTENCIEFGRSEHLQQTHIQIDMTVCHT